MYEKKTKAASLGTEVDHPFLNTVRSLSVVGGQLLHLHELLY